MPNFQDSILNWAQDGIPQIINNSSAIFNIIIAFIGVIIFLLWLYCGVVIYRDAKKRLNVNNIVFYLILMVVGMVLGPLGLVFYYIFRPKYTRDELDFVKVEHKFYYHQASKVVDCLQCGAYVLEGQLYCTNCGFQNRFRCESCKAVTDYDDLYCSNCGKDFEGRYDNILKKINSKPTAEVSSDKEKKPELLPLLKSYAIKVKSKASQKAVSLKEKSNKVIQKLRAKVSEKRNKK